MFEFVMPSLGADMEEGTFVEWLVQPGQAVKRGDLACVVETQKGAVEDGPQNIDSLDEVVEHPGEAREADGGDAPRRREQLRDQEVLTRRRRAWPETLVQVDGRCRAQGGQLARGRAHGGAENHRDQEPDQSRRDVTGFRFRLTWPLSLRGYKITKCDRMLL